ncbi:unnamed protein product [Protopolystoma xenopodis]|uniref:Uncharacterized protein n=1 Tax=Protopolystoma xenopodis TaxID=117903 RepID=A0A448WTA2_9PLAT|nr:unnamed protein product [Protopolystoma xenopodis]
MKAITEAKASKALQLLAHDCPSLLWPPAGRNISPLTEPNSGLPVGAPQAIRETSSRKSSVETPLFTQVTSTMTTTSPTLAATASDSSFRTAIGPASSPVHATPGLSIGTPASTGPLALQVLSGFWEQMAKLHQSSGAVDPLLDFPTFRFDVSAQASQAMRTDQDTAGALLSMLHAAAMAATAVKSGGVSKSGRKFVIIYTS